MTKEEIQGKYHQERIRCLNVQDFLKILDIFNSNLKEDDWYNNEQYTYYSPKLDTVVYSDKGDEILAIDVIKEFENSWVIEDGETISKKSEIPIEENGTFLEKWEKVAPSLVGDGFDVFKTGFGNSQTVTKGLKDLFKDILKDKPSDVIIEEKTRKTLERIDDFIKDSFGQTKEDLEKVLIEKVHHPNHYGGENNVYEAIKIIEAHDLNFVEGNVVKYLLRYKKKNGFEDLEKALWYMNRLVENYKKNN